MSDGSVYIRSLSRGRRMVYYLDEVSRKWRHPWSVSGFYDKTAEPPSWKIQLKPGFINGESPLAGSDELDEEGKSKLLPLTDFPAIPLGEQIFEQTESAPEFFKALGVKDPQKEESNTTGAGLTITLASPEEASPDDRILMQAVVFLTQARASQKMVAQATGNLLLGSLVDYSVSWDTTALSAFGRRPRIGVAKVLPDSPAPDTLNILTGPVEDDSFDHLPIATLYFLSPPGVVEVPPKGPDGTWELYVKHDVFWNMDYANMNKPPINLPGFGLDPVVATFVGRYTFAPAATFAVTQAFVSEALAGIFNSSSNRGRFWTV